MKNVGFILRAMVFFLISWIFSSSGFCMQARSQILRHLKKFRMEQASLNEMQPLIDISVEDEHFEIWKVTYFYPNGHETKEVRLQFELSLSDPNSAPKITVIFPASIRYVCFQELGATYWNKDADLLTLIYQLRTEYEGKAQVFNASYLMTSAEAEIAYQFVKNAHIDWNFVDTGKDNILFLQREQEDKIIRLLLNFKDKDRNLQEILKYIIKLGVSLRYGLNFLQCQSLEYPHENMPKSSSQIN